MLNPKVMKVWKMIFLFQYGFQPFADSLHPQILTSKDVNLGMAWGARSDHQNLIETRF